MGKSRGNQEIKGTGYREKQKESENWIIKAKMGWKNYKLEESRLWKCLSVDWLSLAIKGWAWCTKKDCISKEEGEGIRTYKDRRRT